MPTQRTASRRQINIVHTVNVYTITASVLGQVTRVIGGAKQGVYAFAIAGDGHYTDAYADREGLLVPKKSQALRGTAQRLSHAQRLIEFAVLHKHCELVPADARERVTVAYVVPKERRDLLQQSVSGSMATGVVDDLELIEIEVEKCVLA